MRWVVIHIWRDVTWFNKVYPRAKSRVRTAQIFTDSKTWAYFQPKIDERPRSKDDRKLDRMSSASLTIIISIPFRKRNTTIHLLNINLTKDVTECLIFTAGSRGSHHTYPMGGGRMYPNIHPDNFILPTSCHSFQLLSHVTLNYYGKYSAPRKSESCFGTTLFKHWRLPCSLCFWLLVRNFTPCLFYVTWIIRVNSSEQWGLQWQQLVCWVSELQWHLKSLWCIWGRILPE